MMRWGWLVVVLPLAGGASAAAPPRPAVLPSAYAHYVAAPALRAARRASCGKIRGQSISVDRNSAESTEKSEWAEMRLLTRQMDCRFLGAFYAELRYAAVHHVLGEGAWQSCLRRAPVGHLATAFELGIYLQCLRVIEGTKVCEAARSGSRPYSLPGSTAACADVLRRNDWSQWGEPEWSGTPFSLFHGREPRAGPASPRGTRVLRLPTRIALGGSIRTGFFRNCCLFGMGFVMPFAYLHLPRPITVSDSLRGTVPVRDIELDRDVAGELVGNSAELTCRDLQSGVTGHYALSLYCGGTRIPRASSPAR